MANGSPTLYTPLNLTTDQYTDDVQLVTGLFSNGSGTLAGSSVFTASLSSSDQKYFVTIQDAAGSSGTEYIDISYGHAFGSGSDMSGGANNTAKATQAIYGQMAGAFLDVHRVFQEVNNEHLKAEIAREHIPNLTKALDLMRRYFPLLPELKTRL